MPPGSRGEVLAGLYQESLPCLTANSFLFRNLIRSVGMSQGSIAMTKLYVNLCNSSFEVIPYDQVRLERKVCVHETKKKEVERW